MTSDLLLIEDDPGDALLVQELLADDAHGTWKLSWARNLAEAAPALAARPACVLLDLHLPDGVGLDGLRVVLERAPSSAVVVLTGMVDQDLGVAALAAGAQDYLVKQQVDEHLLSRSLRFAIERKRADEAARRRLQNVRLERSLLPTPDLDSSGVEWATHYAPGGGDDVLGGDFFDVVHLPDGTVRAVVGDVCGHGPDEAALGVSLRISWRALALAGIPAEDVLPILDKVLRTERHDDDLFATVSDVVVAPDRRTIQLRSAGHPPPLVFHHGTAAPLAPEQGPPIAVLDDVVWPALTTRLPQPWTMVLYTDGLIEGRDGAGRWGVEGLTAAAPGLLPMHEAGRLPALVRALAADAISRNGGPLPDDVAILALASPA